MINTEQVPVKVGDEITVEINGYATQGEGLGVFRVLPSLYPIAWMGRRCGPESSW